MIQADVVIFGGGIGGLWTFSELIQKGYSTLLIESEDLGSQQTLASQGMIHGGQRYSLAGALSNHTQSISAMPIQWNKALNGSGEVDLREAKLLSDTQHMWVPGGLLSKAVGFFASQAMDAKVQKLIKQDWPKVFSDNSEFDGTVYSLPEDVLDVKSVINCLIKPAPDRLIKGKWDQICKTLGGYEITLNGKKILAKAILFCAGHGNERAAREFFNSDKLTQRRPLRQILVQTMKDAFYGHCITHDPRPRVTITSHPFGAGYVWYLGGLVATFGTEHSAAEALTYAKQELSELFPHINWDKKKWASFEIDRSEPKSLTGFLPDGPELKINGSIALGWPTKMTFAPAFSHRCLQWIRDLGIMPSLLQDSLAIEHGFEQTMVGIYPWEKNLKWTVLK